MICISVRVIGLLQFYEVFFFLIPADTLNYSRNSVDLISLKNFARLVNVSHRVLPLRQPDLVLCNISACFNLTKMLMCVCLICLTMLLRSPIHCFNKLSNVACLKKNCNSKLSLFLQIR